MSPYGASFTLPVIVRRFVFLRADVTIYAFVRMLSSNRGLLARAAGTKKKGPETDCAPGQPALILLDDYSLTNSVSSSSNFKAPVWRCSSP